MGTQFLFDEATLASLLRKCGFDDVQRSLVGESAYPELVGVERHGDRIGEDLNRFETMAIEATKSASG
jgi:hypothetical protein